MARKLDIEASGFGEVEPLPDQPAQLGFNTEATWIRLSRQRDLALALSPELEEWFAKELPMHRGS